MDTGLAPFDKSSIDVNFSVLQHEKSPSASKNLGPSTSAIPWPLTRDKGTLRGNPEPFDIAQGSVLTVIIKIIDDSFGGNVKRIDRMDNAYCLIKNLLS
jgi:hypothetical protein